MCTCVRAHARVSCVCIRDDEWRMLNIGNTLLITLGVGNADFLKIRNEATQMTHSCLFSSLGEMPGAKKRRLTHLVLFLLRLCFLCLLLLVNPSFGSKHWSGVGIIGINRPELCHGGSYAQKRRLTLPAFAGPAS